jgi:hypothetical protein
MNLVGEAVRSEAVSGEVSPTCLRALLERDVKHELLQIDTVATGHKSLWSWAYDRRYYCAAIVVAQ